MFFDSITVEELLKQAPHNYLRSLGYNIEVKYLANKREDSIAGMVRRLRDTDFLKKVVGKLSWKENEVLKLVMACPAGLESDRLNLQVEKLLKISSRKKGHEIINSLNKKGLIFEGRTEDIGLIYFIPQDLYLRLSKVLAHELWNPLKTYTEEEGERVYLDGPALTRDIYSFLNYLKKSRVRVTQKGLIFKKTLPKIIEGFEIKEDLALQASGLDYPDRFGFIYDYCQSEGLIYLEGNLLLPHNENFAHWVALSIPQRTERIAYFAVGGVGPDWDAGVNTIRFCQPGLWFSASSLKDKVRTLSVEMPRDKNPYFHPEWENPEIDDLFFRFLSYSGIVELILDNRDLVKSFRVTDLGSTVLKIVGYEESFAEASVEKLLLQSNFELMVPRHFPLNLRYRIDQLANLKASDQMNLYEINKESIYRALEGGLGLGEIVSFLQENSKTGLPQNVQYSIAEWAGKYGGVRFLDAFLLMIEDDNLAREIKASKKVGKYIKGELFPTALIVSRGDYDALLAALRVEGYMPRSKIEGFPPPPNISPLPGPVGLVGSQKSPSSLPEGLDQLPFTFKELTNLLQKILVEGASSPQFLQRLEEVANLDFPGNMETANKSGALDEGHSKVKRKMPRGPNPWLEPSGIEIDSNEEYEVLPPVQLERLPPAKIREALQYAIDNDILVLIEVLDKNGHTVVIEVEPYDVWKRGRDYYLEGFSFDDGGEKTFKIEDIKALRLVDEYDDDE